MLKLPTYLIAGALAGMFSISHAARAEDTKTYEYRGGASWPEVKSVTTQPVATDETLDRVEALLDGKQTTAAKKQAVYWIKTHPKEAALRDRALFLLGQCNFRYGDRIEAFYNFDELLDLYPESRFFYPALQRQYDIADGYLNGSKRKVLFFLWLGAEEEAIEMLYRVQQRSPGSPLAEKSLLRTADYYYREAEFDLASDTYAVFVRTYPRSPEVPRVKLRQAFSNYAQFRGLKFDVTPIIDAREQLMAIQQQYPAMAAEENLQPVIERIDSTFARKIFVTGDFYERTGERRAAAYQYKFLLKTYPNSPDAALAKARLSKLPPNVVLSIDPPAGKGYSPSTGGNNESK